MQKTNVCQTRAAVYVIRSELTILKEFY